MNNGIKSQTDETASLNTALLCSSIYNIKDNVRKTSFCSMFEDKETPRRVEEISASCPQRRRSTCQQPWLLVRPPSPESLARGRANSGCSAAGRYPGTSGDITYG